MRALVATLLLVATARAAEPVRLGAVYDLTGSQAALDGPSAAGARLAAQRIGTVLGRPLQLDVRDGRSDPATVRAQTAALAAGGAVALLGLSDTDMAVAAGEAAAQARRPFLTSGATSPALPADVPEWLFLACFTDAAQATVGAQFARRQLGARTAALLVQQDMTYATVLGRHLADAFVASGGQIVGRRVFHASDVDAALAHLVRHGETPDVLFVASGPELAPRVVRAARAQGFRGPIVGGDAFDTDALVAAGDDVWFTTHAFLDARSADPAVRAFVAAYRTAYRRDPDAFAALGWDAVGLLADAAGRAGSTDPDAIRRALGATTGYRGVTGTIGYVGGRRAPRKTVFVVRASDGTRTLAAAMLPEPPAR